MYYGEDGMFLALMKIQHAIWMANHLVVTADVTRNKTQNERLKVAFRSMFLQRKKSQRFGPSSFSKFQTDLSRLSFPSATREH